MCLERPRTKRNKESIRRADRDSIKYSQEAVSYVSQADAVSHHSAVGKAELWMNVHFT